MGVENSLIELQILGSQQGAVTFYMNISPHLNTTRDPSSCFIEMTWAFEVSQK